MTWQLVLLAVILGAGLLAGLMYGKLQRENKQLRTENKLLSWFDHRIPVWSRFYFDRTTGRDCRRCDGGRMWRRYRYQLVANDEDGTTVRELTGLYWCGKCQYRGLSLRELS